MHHNAFVLSLWFLLVAIALSLSGEAATGHVLFGDSFILHHIQHTPGGEQMEAVADGLHLVQWAPVGLAIIVALVKRRTGLVIAGVLVMLALTANGALKDAIERPRPDVALIREHASGYGFPSGHAMTSMLLYGYAAVVVAAIWPRFAWAAAGAAAIVLLLIGFDRVYNGVHWPSDVLGGWAWGALLLIAALEIGAWVARRLPARWEATSRNVNEPIAGSGTRR